MNGLVGKNLANCSPDRRRVRAWWALLAILAIPSGLLAGCSGCGDSSSSMLPDGSGFPDGSGESSLSEQTPEGLLEIAVDSLNRQEEFPSGGMLRQSISQLDQWVRTQKPLDDWEPDPLAADMPGTEDLARLQFPRSDGLALQEAIWLRNVSRWARGNEAGDLIQARQLFDWTIRNIQLEVITELSAEQRLTQMPWETLLLGRGTAVERGWVFMLLARQQGLDTTLLALRDPDNPDQAPPLPWAVGLLAKGNVYVFDPALGLPLPGPEGIRLDDRGALTVRPATLAELAGDDSLLRRLDLDQQRPYPLNSADLGRVVALVEASPSYLTQRMKLLEARLLGDRRVVLSTSATAQSQRWKAVPGIADAQLWMLPYQVLVERQNATEEQSRQRFRALLPFYATYAEPEWNPDPSQSGKETDPFYVPRRASLGKGAKYAPLRRARILHFKGQFTRPLAAKHLKEQFTGPQAAIQAYQEARLSDEQLANLAEHYYEIALKGNERLPDEQRATRQQLQQVTAQRAEADEPFLRRASQDASYWLGLMNFDLGRIQRQQDNAETSDEHYRVAVDYLSARTLAASPEGPWTHGAQYNVARSYEAIGQYDDAIAAYTSDPTSPTYHGSLLRARWLNQLRSTTDAEPDAEPDDEPPPPESDGTE